MQLPAKLYLEPLFLTSLPMLKTCIVSVLLLLPVLFLPAPAKAQEVHIVNLKTEYTPTPLGIDIANPRFSWQMDHKKVVIPKQLIK